jgi:hypothetical protein
MEHVKRPKLDRTQPIRQWANLFEGPAGSPPPPADGTAPDGPAEHGTATLGDMLTRSVEIGYRVVDEYVRQGQKAASRLSRGPAATDGLTGDLQDFNVRMMQHASELFGVWFDFVDRYVAGGLVPRPSGAPSATPAGAANGDEGTREPVSPPAVDRARVRVEVVSPWPTEVTVDLRAGAGGTPLVVQSLHAVEPEKPRLEGIVFECATADAPPCLRVRVPGTQPAGVYHGMLVDAQTSVPAGTVSVRVSHDG